MNECSVRGRSRRVALVAASVLAAMAANSVHAQSRAQATADAALQREADRLQACLESQLAPLQIESTLSRDGRITENIRMTRWGNNAQSAEIADRAITRCIASAGAVDSAVKGIKDNCVATHGLQRLITLDFAAGEPHPAWSANDRARLETLIPATLTELSGNVRVQTPTADAMTQTAELLRVRLEYRGSPISQRDLDDWIRLPRELQIQITVIDTRSGNRIIAARDLTARVRPGLRGRFAANTGDAWFREVRSHVDDAAREVLTSLACRAAQFEVTIERGKLHMSIAGFRGLAEGRSVLLVPTAEAAVASRWPIARIRALPRSDTAELEVLRGAAETCNAGCRAVPL